MRAVLFVCALALVASGSARASDGAAVLNDMCSTLGLTRLANDGTAILSCLLRAPRPATATECTDSANGCTWQPISGATAAKPNYLQCVNANHGGNASGSWGALVYAGDSAEFWCPTNYIMVGLNGGGHVQSAFCCKVETQ